MQGIEKLISADYKIFIDTCSLMWPAAPEYISEVLIPALRTGNASVVVPLRVIKELNRLRNKEGDTETLVLSGLSAVALMLSEGVLEMFGDENDGVFADNYFLYLFTKLRMEYNLALVTQDKELALDIHSLSSHRSVKGQKKILLLKINGQRLVEWEFGDSGAGKDTKFQLCATPREAAGGDIPLKKVPAVGDAVYSKKYGQIMLRDKIFKTRSGNIYHTDHGIACKIYSPKNLTYFQIEKLEKMLQAPVKIKGVCWPLDVVRDPGEFVGYLMPKFAGDPIKETVFSKKLLEKNFTHWTRKELVSLCLTILKKIERLHEINVLVCDLNSSNIFIKSEKEVYFIETDTYQVEDFPCQHSSVDFLVPELRGKRNGTFLQTKEQEYYGLATLLFMILLPGKHPFAFRNGNGIDDRMRCTEFPYPLGEKKNNYTLGKPWNYIWSNLPYKIKRMFYGIFKENMRMSPGAWIKVLREYLLLLDNGYISNELFPERRKIINPVEVTCSRCGIREAQERKWVESLTLQGKIYFCETCLEEIRQGKM